MTNSVMIECAGKCGRITYTTKARASRYDEFLCDDAEDGDECLKRLPMPPGMVTVTTPKAAGKFAGVTYRMPTEAEAARIAALKETP